MSEDAGNPGMNQPRRSRAVFSLEDFQLLKTAIRHYMPQLTDEKLTAKYSNLFHRLGRIE